MPNSLAEMLVREVGQRAARTPRRPRANASGGISSVVDDAAADQQHAHDERRRAQQLLGVADAARPDAPRCRPASPLTSGITATPVSKPERPSASFGKSSSANASIISGLPCCATSAACQRGKHSGMLRQICSSAHADHDDVQRRGRRRRCRTARPIASWNPLRKTAPRAAQQHQRHQRSDGRATPGTNGLLDDVRGRVGGRQRDGDDEVGRGEAEQAEDERLAAPARQQLLEHRDAALAVRAELGDAAVDRQRAEERQQDQDEAWRSARAAPAARNAMPGW